MVFKPRIHHKKPNHTVEQLSCTLIQKYLARVNNTAQLANGFLMLWPESVSPRVSSALLARDNFLWSADEKPVNPVLSLPYTSMFSINTRGTCSLWTHLPPHQIYILQLLPLR